MRNVIVFFKLLVLLSSMLLYNLCAVPLNVILFNNPLVKGLITSSVNFDLMICKYLQHLVDHMFCAVTWVTKIFYQWLQSWMLPLVTWMHLGDVPLLWRVWRLKAVFRNGSALSKFRYAWLSGLWSFFEIVLEQNCSM